MKKVYFFIGMLLFVSVSNVNAQILMQWNTFGNVGTETTEPSIFNDPNLSGITNLTQGSITAATNGNRFGGSGWFNVGNTALGNTITEAVAGNDYIQFIITPNAGYSFTPTSFVFQWDKSGTGPKNIALRSSADGFAADLGALAPVAALGTPNTINISGLVGLSVATTFRVYGYGATATGGTGGFDVTTNVVNVQLNGTTAGTGSSSTLANITQPTGNILQAATNVVLAGFSITPGVAVNFTDMTVTSAGTATATDITNVRIYRDNDGNGAINGADAAVTGPAAQAYSASMVFAGITSETGISVATYYLVVADVAAIGVSTPGRTTTVSSNTFTTTATTNTGSFTGNSRIITAPPGTSTITPGAGAEPATMSSLTNTQGAASLNYDFTITDDGGTPATDILDFQISQIVLNAGTGNAVTNWTTAIAGVELSDGTNSTTVATIGVNSITFPGILNAVGDLGYIADNAAKTYTLKIWLNTNQAALSTVIDGKDFVFRIRTADVTVAGSQLTLIEDQNSGDGNNTVDVAATSIAYVAQPVTTPVGVGMTAVTVSANDVNGNRDLHFTSSLDITSTGTLTATPITVAAVSGLATFNAITHTVVGTGFTLNAERNGTLDWDVVSTAFNITVVNTYTWNGGNGLWTTAGNWTPTRTTPDPADVLQFNDGSTVTVTAVPTQTIGRLLITNNTVVSLEAPAANTLTIGEGAGIDLDVQLGSQLNSTGTLAALTILLSSRATGSITGNMTFANAAHKFNAADANAVTFNSPAVFTQGTGCSGNVFTNAGTADVMVFGNGTTFLQVTGSNPFALGSPASKVVFQTGSLFKIQQNAAPSLAGRTYANLEIDFAAFSVSAIGTSVLNIDNLTITQGVFNLNLTGGISIKGNIAVAAGATLTFTPATPNTLSLNGTTPQSISNLGTLTFTANENITINNALGVTLNSPITISGALTLTSGLITNTATNLLTMAAGSSVTGASNASFVKGPIKKIGNTDFTFPVGKANGYVPIAIEGFVGGTASDEFTGEYIRSSAMALGPITAGVGLDHVSACDYWTLNKGIATPTSVNVKGYWSANNVCGTPGSYITDLPTVTMAHYDGSGWNSFPVSPILTGGSTLADGSISWPGVTTFSPFSLGSSTFGLNPLPISINYFTGAKNNGNHLLNWKLTCVSSPSASIDMERSIDGRNYSSIYSVYATALRCQQPFNYTDNAPAKGVNYYRLKMTDANGKVTYSSVVSLINAIKGIELMNISPNPIVNSAFNLNISAAAKTQMDLVITDMQGRVMQRQSVPMIAGFNQIPVTVKNLAAGTYQLVGNTADGRTRVLRFVIQ